MLFFVSKSDICNVGDNNTISSCGKMLFDILHNLKFHLEYVLKVNSLKLNPGKFQSMTLLGANPEIKVNLLLDRNRIEKFLKVALLGITIGDKLNFKTHIEDVYRLASYKLHALQRIRKYFRSQNTFFSWNRNCFFLKKTLEKPYLNLHFKFHDFFSWSNEYMKVLSLGFFSFQT